MVGGQWSWEEGWSSSDGLSLRRNSMVQMSWRRHWSTGCWCSSAGRGYRWAPVISSVQRLTTALPVRYFASAANVIRLVDGGGVSVDDEAKGDLDTAERSEQTRHGRQR